jgi:hypothetical protein
LRPTWLLSHRKFLLVTATIPKNDAWTIGHAGAFSVVTAQSRLLITTRNNEVLVGLGAEEHRVGVLSSIAALKFAGDNDVLGPHDNFAVAEGSVTLLSRYGLRI